MENRSTGKYLRRDDSYRAAPTKPNTEKRKKRHVETVRATLGFGEDLAVLGGDAWWQGLLALGHFAGGLAVESGRGDLFKVRVLIR